MKLNFLGLVEFEVDAPARDVPVLGGSVSAVLVGTELRLNYDNVGFPEAPFEMRLRPAVFRQLRDGSWRFSRVTGFIEIPIEGQAGVRLDPKPGIATPEMRVDLTLDRRAVETLARKLFPPSQILPRGTSDRFRWNAADGDDQVDFVLELVSAGRPPRWRWIRRERAQTGRSSEADVHDFAEYRSEAGARTQTLQIMKIEGGIGELPRVLLEPTPVPRFGRVLDIDPGLRDRSEAASIDGDNVLTYGMSLTHGQLEIGVSEHGWSGRRSLRWVPRRDRSECSVLLNSVLDEHGLPSVFRSSEPIELRGRTPFDQYGEKFDHAMTIGGLVLAPKPEGLEGRVLTLAPSPAGPDREGLGWKLDADDEPALRQSSPRELHPPIADSFFTADSNADGVAARILVHDLGFEVPPPEAGVLSYAFAALELRSSWTLRSMYAEQEFVDAKDGSFPGGRATVGFRDSERAASITLPLGDVELSAANVLRSTGEVGWLVEQTQASLLELDGALVSSFRTIGKGKAQIHSSLLELRAQSGGRHYESILGRPRARIASLTEVVAQPVSTLALARGSALVGDGPELLEYVVGSKHAYNLKFEHARLELEFREWLFEAYALGTTRAVEEFRDIPGAFAVWQTLEKVIKTKSKLAKLDGLLDKALAEVELREAATRYCRQVAWVLSLVDVDALKRLAAIATEVRDYASFVRAWRGPAAKPELARIATAVAWVVHRWPELSPPPSNFALPAATAIHHRIVVGLVQIGRQISRRSDSVERDLQKALGKLRDRLQRARDPISEFNQLWLDRASELRAQLALVVAWALPITGSLAARLQTAWSRVDGQFSNYFEQAERFSADIRNLRQLVVSIRDGREEAVAKLREEWEKNPPPAPLDVLKAELRQRVFNDEVYQAILRRAEQAHAFGDELARLIGLGEDAGRLLHTLRTEAPGYVVIGRSFDVRYGPDQDALIRRMTRYFEVSLPLCDVGSGNAWDFEVPSTEATVILKATGELGIREILEQIQLSYRDDTGELDPLGLWTKEYDKLGVRAPHLVGDGEHENWTRDLVRVFVNEFVDPEVARPSWRGVFIINPLADFRRNPATRDICGISHLGCRYIAIQGGERGAGLDTFATIYRSTASDEPEVAKDADAGVTLVTFDARIRNASLRSGTKIILRLDIDRLWGAHRSDPGNRSNYSNITITGKLADTGLEFAAVFDRARTLEIGVAFVKSLSLRAIRAASVNGRTSFEFDGDLELQNWEFARVGEGVKLGLSNFRLNFPELDGEAMRAMGHRRELLFDIGSVVATFDRPRAIRLGFLELQLRSLGYIRKRLEEAADSVDAEYERIRARYGDVIGGISGSYELPYMEFDVGFGKLPKLGGSGIGELSLKALVGVERQGPRSFKPVLRIGGLAAKDIHIDFFRVLTLSIRDLYLLRDVESLLDPARHYSAIGAVDLRLSLLGIDLIGGQTGDLSDRGLDFVLLENSAGQKGVLGVVHFGGDRGSVDADHGAVAVNWVLLARNIEVESKILDHLLSNTEDPDSSTLAKILDRQSNPAKLNAGLTGKDDWLFGISFRLFDILQNCRLILHDEHYYGISLTGDWLAALIGGDTVTLAYIPGNSARQDRFFLDVPLAALNLFAGFRAGWLTLSWAFNTDALVGLGFPWRDGARYRWDRSFEGYVTPFMAQFGMYLAKRSVVTPRGSKALELSAGLALSFGLGIAVGNGIAYVRAGIVVFAILEGSLTLSLEGRPRFDEMIDSLTVVGVIGILAFVEGGINIWIISAHFRVELQASLRGEIHYQRGQPLMLRYSATLYAHYSASARIKIGWFKISFSVSGRLPITIAGQAALKI